MKMHRFCSEVLSVLVAVFGVCPSAWATDYTSPSFIVRDPVVNDGGAYASSTSFQYFSSTGEAAIGRSSSSSYSAREGFLNFPEPSEPVVTPPTPPSPGGGGGGGGSMSVSSVVVLRGAAFPYASVSVLKDGVIVTKTSANAQGVFEAAVNATAGIDSSFGLLARDTTGLFSPLLTVLVHATAGSTAVSGLLLSPTFIADKSSVPPGTDVVFTGQTAPGAEVFIMLDAGTNALAKVKADASGRFTYTLKTKGLTAGMHVVKAQASIVGGLASGFSEAVRFEISGATVKPVVVPPPTVKPTPGVCRRADLNCDGKVNFTDFSIAAYWVNRPLSAEFEKIEKARLNGDGKVTLTDFSIIGFYWTGK